MSRVCCSFVTLLPVNPQGRYSVVVQEPSQLTLLFEYLFVPDYEAYSLLAEVVRHSVRSYDPEGSVQRMQKPNHFLAGQVEH